MNKDFFYKVAAQIKKLRPRKPIISHDPDVKLLRRVQGRRFPHVKQFFHISKILSKRERLLFRFSVLVLLVGAVWFGISIADNYRVHIPAVGGRYTEAVVGSPELINPIFAPLNDVDMDITRLVYSGLMRVDDKQRIVPDLAVSSTISEDKQVYTFKLREDVLWHDGETFTANDVVFTIGMIQNTEVNSPLLVSFQGVHVEAVDDYTVRFTLAEPFAPFLSSLTVGILPEHIWFDISPERVPLAQKNLQPVGTGPFMFKKLLKDETGFIYQYELERSPQHYRQAPFIKEFVFQFFVEYASDTGAIHHLRQQNVDGLHFVPNDLREQAQRKHINLYTLQMPQYTALFFNRERQPALEDEDVRTALVYALDKDRILREALNGEGQVIDSPILPGFPGYNPEIEKTPYSVAEANELLDKEWDRFSAEEYREMRKGQLVSEWLAANPVTSTEEVGGDTGEEGDVVPEIPEEVNAQIEEHLDTEINEAQTFYRKDEDGNILEIKLVTTDTEEYKHAAEQIAGFWQELGVKTMFEFVDAKEFSHQVLKGRSYDVLLYGVIVGSDPDQYPFWHSTQVDFPGLNLAGYINRNADALLEEAREASDEEKVIEAYKKFQDMILTDRPATFLYMPTYTYAVSDKIKGIDLTRIFNPADRFTDVANWYIKTEGKWMLRKS